MRVLLKGVEVDLLPEGGAWIQEESALIVADLHFEKDTFYNARGTFLPPYASLETFQKLADLIAHTNARHVVAAGDSFHDKAAANRMSGDAIDRLNALVQSVQTWSWVTGNHDRTISANISGARENELSIRGIVVRHETMNADEAEISGHYHPKLKKVVMGHRMSARCFVLHKDRLILPAFGQYTGGLDIDAPAFTAIAPKETRNVFALHGGDIVAVFP